MIKANKYEIALLATVDFLNKGGEELTLKIGEGHLKELLRLDKLPSNENALAEQLLICENFTVIHDEKYVVSSILDEEKKKK